MVIQAVDSVLTQTFKDLEIIVVDDGSTDNTRDAIAVYGDRVTYIFQEHAGAAAARNRALRAARGEYVALTDSDDLMAPIRMQSQVTFLDEHPAVGVVHTGWEFMDKECAHVLNEVRPVAERDMLRDLVLPAVLYPTPMHTSSAMFRREIIDRVGFFDEELETLEDVYFWIKVASAGIRFHCLPEPMSFWRNTPSSLGKDLAKLERMIPVFLRKVFDETNLPPEIGALRERASAICHREMGQQYYNALPPDSHRGTAGRYAEAHGTSGRHGAGHSRRSGRVLGPYQLCGLGLVAGRARILYRTRRTIVFGPCQASPAGTTAPGVTWRSSLHFTLTSPAGGGRLSSMYCRGCGLVPPGSKTGASSPYW